MEVGDGSDLVELAGRRLSHLAPGSAAMWLVLSRRQVWLQRALVVGSVGVAAGAAVAVFMLTEALWLRPLPIREAEDVVIVQRHTPAGLMEQTSLASASRWMTDAATASDIGAELARSALLQDFRPRLTWGADGAPVHATAVTSGYFEVFRVRVLGRTFASEDDSPGARPVVILSHSVWRARFGGASDVVGSVVDLGRIKAQVIGIAEAGFGGPRLGDHVEVWLSFGAVPSAAGIPGDLLRLANVTTYARIRHGVSARQAEAELRQLSLRPQEVIARPLVDVPYSPEHATLAAVDGQMVTLLCCLSAALLLIGMVNLSAFEAAGFEAKRRDVAMRLALGGTRWSLLKEAVGEAIVLGLLGGAAAVWVARVGTAAISDLSLPSGVMIGTLHFGGLLHMLLVAVAIGTVMASTKCVAFWRALSSDLSVLIRRTSRVSTGRYDRTSIILCLHVAITTVLLIATMLFTRTLQLATSFDLGFARDRVFGVLVQPRVGQFSGDDGPGNGDARQRRAAAFARLLEAAQALPGVSDVTSGELPLKPLGMGIGTTGAPPNVWRMGVGPRYAGVVGLAVKAGRDLEDSDMGLEPRRVLVSEAFARRRWANSPAVGRVFDLDERVARQEQRDSAIGPRFVVVGVVADALRGGFQRPPTPAIYEIRTGLEAAGSGVMVTAVVRTRDSAETTLREVISLARQVFDDPVQLHVESASSVMADEFHVQRLGRTLLAWISAVALALAAAGAFSIVAAATSARRREFATRLALGAAMGDVCRLAARAGVLPALVGCAIGLLISGGIGRAIEAYLFGVAPIDLWAAVVSAATVLAIAGCASYVPARRIGQIDIAGELRRE